MRLQVERSGGFAGRTVSWRLDTDGLDPDGRAELQELLAQAPAWSTDASEGGSAGTASGPVPPARPGADRFSYRLVAEGSDDAPLEVRFGEPLPPPAQRLLDLVRDAPA